MIKNGSGVIINAQIQGFVLVKDLVASLPIDILAS